MHSESRRHTLYHRLARAATVALAALTMAGCGGDWEVSFSGIDDNDKKSPSVFVVVSPARPTVGAGTIVRFEAVAIDATPPTAFSGTATECASRAPTTRRTRSAAPRTATTARCSR